MRSKERFLAALAAFLVIVLLGYFGVSFLSSLAGEFYLNNPLFHILFAFILLLLTVAFVFFIRNLALFFFPHFKTNLKVKIFTAFLLLILGPALFSLFLASGVINRGLDRLLRIQVSRIVNTSQTTVNSLLDFIFQDMERKLDQLSAKRRVYPYTLRVYGLDGFFVKAGRRTYKVGSFPEDKVKEILKAKREKFSLVDYSDSQLILCKERFKSLYCVSKRLPKELALELKKQAELYNNYNSLVAYKRPIKAVYTITFAFMGIAVVFGALWFARYFERRISIPIEALYRATNRISKGDLSVEIPEEEATDELKHVIHAFNDMVSQLRNLKENLEENRRYLQELLDSVSPAIITFNGEGKVVSCNRKAKELFSFKPSNRGSSILELLSLYPNLLSAVKELLEKGKSKTEVREEIKGREKFFSVELISSPELKDRILIIEDITDIVKAKKAEAWREVARRIAHEIKNPLTPITLNAERIRRQLKKGAPNLNEVIEKSVNSILEEVEVIKRLIDEFRKFSRLPLPEKRLTDLNSLIRSSLEPYMHRIKIDFELEDIPKIPVDRVLIREVLINLVENSIEAGATEVKVSTTYKDNKVFIVFTDNGPGIPEEVMDKLFNPYITTKEEGWGLGLSIVKKIIEDHGGRIYTVDKNTFVIELPF
ncbi:ATP-binding protein [Thermovibrio sp.]